MSRPELKAIRQRCDAVIGEQLSYSYHKDSLLPATLFVEYEGDELDIAVFDDWSGMPDEIGAIARFLEKAKPDMLDLLDEIERLQGLLREALPHIECENPAQSGLITEIGEYIDALTVYPKESTHE